MRVHDLSPYVVFGQDPPPWRDNMFPPGPGGQHFSGISASELLYEPPEKATNWLSMIYTRLLVASTGPVLMSEQSQWTDRMERARWLRIAQDANARDARMAAWPALGTCQKLNIGMGSLAPDLVIVAERDPYERHPMFARSGVWLFRALRELGYDELTVYVTNALDGDSRSQAHKLAELRDAFGGYDPVWVALGAIPNEVLNNAGVEHFAVEHPSAHRRFSFQEGPSGYARKLEEAGVPRRTGVTMVKGSTKSDLYERLGIPSTPNVKPGTQEGRVKRRVPTPILDKARMKFVLGEANTIRDAAKMASDSKSEQKAIVKIAREQGWEAERERYYAQRREQAKSSASEAEAKRIGESRALAWEASQLMLQQIVNNLRDPSGEMKVHAKDAKAIAEIAISLSEKGDMTTDEEKKRLATLSPEAFADHLKATLAPFGVVEEKKPG